MTELMTKALEALRKLPDERQDELAPFLLALADEEPLTEADKAAIAEAEAELARGEHVAPETMRAFWAKHGL
jgi:predicted transcriptional regulator